MDGRTVEIVAFICALLGNFYLIIKTYLNIRKARLLRITYSFNIRTNSLFRVDKFGYDHNNGYTLLYNYHGLNHKTAHGLSRQYVRTSKDLYLVVL